MAYFNGLLATLHRRDRIKAMYESSLGLRESPFSSAPREDRYVALEGAERARLTLSRTLLRGQGAAVLIGGPGLGKSTIARVVLDDVRRELTPILFTGGQVTSAKSLFRTLLHEVQLPIQGLDEDELRLAWLDFISQPQVSQCGIALFVDEAQLLSTRLLEELRLLTGPSYCGLPIVRLFLAGGPSLDERLSSPRLALLEQRIASRCYLEPLSSDEVRRYVLHRLALSGARKPEDLFASDVWSALRELTDGVPRLINLLADAGLEYMASSRCDRVDAAILRSLWADQQQFRSVGLPSGATPVTSVLEFGSLTKPSTGFEPSAPHETANRVKGIAEAERLNTDECALNAMLNKPVQSASDRVAITTNAPASEAVDVQALFEWNGQAVIELNKQSEAFDSEVSEGMEFDEADCEWANDEPFRPAGRIGPLDSQPVDKGIDVPEAPPVLTVTPLLARNPFDEEFDDEELVIDQSAKLQRASIAQFQRENLTDVNLTTAVKPSAASADSGPVPAMLAPVSIKGHRSAEQAEAVMPGKTQAADDIDIEIGDSIELGEIERGRFVPFHLEEKSTCAVSPFDFVVEVSPGVCWNDSPLHTQAASNAAPAASGVKSVDSPHNRFNATVSLADNASAQGVAEQPLINAVDAPLRNVELKDYRLFFSELRGGAR